MIGPEGYWTPPEDATPEPESAPDWLPVVLLVVGAGAVVVVFLVFLVLM